MNFCTKNPNIVNEQPPANFTELVKFVEFVQKHPDPIFVQISGYVCDVVRELAAHFKTNFFDYQNTKSIEINPFTIIYIDQAGEILPRCINEKSKLVIYAKRANHHHH